MDSSQTLEDRQSELLVVFVTFPSLEKARQIGTQLVKRQLIACINCLPEVSSIYQWEGKLCEDKESLGIMKTTAEKWTELEQLLYELHPYDTPEIVALPTEKVAAPYRAWVQQSVAD